MNLRDISTEDLIAELDRRRPQIQADKEREGLLEISRLNLNGITTKDFVVNYAVWDDGLESIDWSFYIKKPGFNKLYCIYTDAFECHKWWPRVELDEFYNDEDADYKDQEMCRLGAKEFVPRFFVEASENNFESRYSFEETMEKLRLAGFEAILPFSYE